MKKRVNSRKGLKIEHVSEATAGQTKQHSSDMGGVSGHQNPDWKPVLEAPRGQQASSVLTVSPGATHSAKKRNLSVTGPPRRSGRRNEALWGQQTEQTPGLQHMARAQEKERGWGNHSPCGGTGFPLKWFMQHLGVQGR